MPPTDALLLAALRSAPRRYRMPPLPADARSAAAGGTGMALAFAIEAARKAHASGMAPPAGTRELFTDNLAALVRQALAAPGGDPAFQAMLLHAREPDVQAFERLDAQAGADRRTLRMAVDAFAHPGKLRAPSAGRVREDLAELHGLALAGDGDGLAGAAAALLAQPPTQADAALQAALAGVLSSEALRRLRQRDALLALPAVQHYRALCEQRGPSAGSDAAAAQGRASARVGGVAERATAEVFTRIAQWLDAHSGGGAGYRALRGLRTPRGFPGETGKAKDEWDAAIVRRAGAGDAVHIVLLAEVKASPAAAPPDYSRLLRGLQRLALANAGEAYTFASADGDVRIAGASLQALQPQGRALPPQVVYCCSAPTEPPPPWLSPATQAVLLGEPASLAFADQLYRGEAPPAEALVPVWEALPKAPRLLSALHQYPTAVAARDAMVHPQDLWLALSGAASPTA